MKGFWKLWAALSGKGQLWPPQPAMLRRQAKACILGGSWDLGTTHNEAYKGRLMVGRRQV